MLKLVISILCLTSLGFYVLFNRMVQEWWVEQGRKLDARWLLNGNKKMRKFSRGLDRYIHTRKTKKTTWGVLWGEDIRKTSKLYKIYEYYATIISDGEMAKYKITVSGLIVFIFCMSVSVSLFLCGVLGVVRMLPLLVITLMYLFSVIFRFISLMQFEKKDAEVMDAVDLIVTDIEGGVTNAIKRYQDSFHANIRPYFLTYLDDLQTRGSSFEVALQKLQESLGVSFYAFTQKALLFEKKGEKDMVYIFSDILELNRQKRILRERNKLKFNEIRMQFVLSTVVIGGYAISSSLVDSYILHFLTKTTIGHMLVLLDLVIVTGVLAYIAAIKAKSL